MTSLLYFFGLAVGYVLWIWFIRNPQKIKDVGQTRFSQYILYGGVGFGVGVVAAGFLDVFLLNSSTFLNVQGDMKVLMPIFAIAGIGSGVLAAYLHPATLTISPQTQANLDKLAQAQEDAKKMPPAKGALIQGVVLTVISGAMLLLNYFFSIFSNLQDQYTGVQTPAGLLYAVFYVCLVIGIYDILYFLFICYKKGTGD